MTWLRKPNFDFGELNKPQSKTAFFDWGHLIDQIDTVRVGISMMQSRWVHPNDINVHNGAHPYNGNIMCIIETWQ